MRRYWLIALFIAGCGDDADPPGTSSMSTSTGAGGTAATSSGMGTSSASTGGSGGGSGGSGGQGDYTVTSGVITTDHRFIDGQMFGGWGPHLGHLVRAGSGELFFVDDVCAQMGGGDFAICNVNDDHTLGYFRRGVDAWELVASTQLPGTVQQNTATIASADGSKLHTYGIDVAAGQIVECTFPLPSGPAACAALAFVLGPSSNYIGAALSPDGYRMVWWTGVVDGGGGTFHYIVDYGGGWNGPRSGPVAGYNDASYINIGFPTGAPARFVMHVQLVGGLAPNWTFHGGVGTGDLTTSDPVAWSLPLAAVNGDDPVVSTNDVWVDPATQDEHVVARTNAGRAAYYHRPAGGAWSPPLFWLDATYRARFVPHGDRLAMVYGPNGAGLAFRVAGAADRSPGEPIDWALLAERAIVLPEGYEDVYAIYPGAPPYQLAPSGDVEIAVVGAVRQYEVLGVALAPP
jgi:hypothetical protein